MHATALAKGIFLIHLFSVTLLSFNFVVFGCVHYMIILRGASAEFTTNTCTQCLWTSSMASQCLLLLARANSVLHMDHSHDQWSILSNHVFHLLLIFRFQYHLGTLKSMNIACKQGIMLYSLIKQNLSRVKLIFSPLWLLLLTSISSLLLLVLEFLF